MPDLMAPPVRGSGGLWIRVCAVCAEADFNSAFGASVVAEAPWQCRACFCQSYDMQAVCLDPPGR